MRTWYTILTPEAVRKTDGVAVKREDPAGERCRPASGGGIARGCPHCACPRACVHSHAVRKGRPAQPLRKYRIMYHQYQAPAHRCLKQLQT